MISPLCPVCSSPCDTRHPVQHLQRDNPRVHQHFTCMLEINGDPAVDHGLHLTDAPIRALRVADELPWFEEECERRHADVTPLAGLRFPVGQQRSHPTIRQCVVRATGY
jgi:hypothetical protein